MTVTELRQALEAMEAQGKGAIPICIDVEWEYFYDLRRGSLQMRLDHNQAPIDGTEVLALSGGVQCGDDATRFNKRIVFEDPPDE